LTTIPDTQMDQLVQKNAIDRRLALSIMLSIDIESNFKLYSYRVITQTIFLERTAELLSHYKEAIQYG